jgi:glyoxylase-like metal-dependent hydrolase (beta-lactamase superfamily II)
MPRPDFKSAALSALLLVSASAGSQSPEGMAATVEAQQLEPGIHLLSGAGCNILVWSGSEGTVLVDTGTAAASEALRAVLAEIAPDSSTRFVVNTHWHPDHTGGNLALARSGAVVVAHENTRARMSAPQDLGEYGTRVPAAPKGALPVVTFADTLTLSVNGGRLTLLHMPEAHTDGDAIAWLSEANVAHLGDLYYAGEFPFIDTAHGGSLAGVVAAIEAVLARANARTVIVPGHGPVGTRADLVAYRDMLVAVGTRVRELVEQGASLAETVEAKPTADWDERYGAGAVSPERFARILYEDLTSRR